MSRITSRKQVDADENPREVTGTIHGDKNALDIDTRGASDVISVSPTISTSAYTAGDNVGGAMTLSDAARIDGGTCVIESIAIVDKDSEEAVFDFHFFSDAPSATDNAAFDPTDTQLVDHYLGTVYGVGDSDVDSQSVYSTFSDNSVCSKRNIGLVLECATDSRAIYCVVTTQGTPTYTSTSDLNFKFGFLQD